MTQETGNDQFFDQSGLKQVSETMSRCDSLRLPDQLHDA